MDKQIRISWPLNFSKPVKIIYFLPADTKYISMTNEELVILVKENNISKPLEHDLIADSEISNHMSDHDPIAKYVDESGKTEVISIAHGSDLVEYLHKDGTSYFINSTTPPTGSANYSKLTSLTINTSDLSNTGIIIIVAFDDDSLERQIIK